MRAFVIIMAFFVTLAIVHAAHAAPSSRCTEDMTCWNCATMGNKVCGPAYSMAEAKRKVVRYERRSGRPFDLLRCRRQTAWTVVCRVREHLPLLIPQPGYEGILVLSIAVDANSLAIWDWQKIVVRS